MSSLVRTGFKYLGDEDFVEDKGGRFLGMTWEPLGMVGRVGTVGIRDILSVEAFLIKILCGEHA